jgi:serine/threonine-protein kinase
MADVLLCVGRGPSGFNKLVVLKTMRKELVADDDMRQMFLAEARLSARLNNANVVQVYEVADTTLPCIVMEYLEGQPLSSLEREAGELFTIPMQLKVLSEALSGLHYSHELKDYDGTPLNIVHRDISPQNIFVTYDGGIKVLDFGIAKASNVRNQTRTGIIKGKIAYMPREQLLNEDTDRRADIYAIGCMLWRAAAGEKLWSGVPDGDVMRALIEGRIPLPSEKRPVDPKLEAIVMKALAPEPAERYPTALALRIVIDEYLSETSPKTNMREVGELVSEVFAEQQEARKQQIQTALQAPLSEAPPEIPEGIQSIIQMTTEDTGVSRGPRRQMLWTAITAAFAASLVVGGALVYFTLREGRAVATRSPVVAPPTQIQVRLTASPAGAALAVDGNAASGNPALLTVPADTRDHEVNATLDGYEPFRKRVRFERDLSLEIMLQPLPSPPASNTATTTTASNHAPTTKKVHAPASADNKPKSSCDPPFYFENGIKTYKPGCL